MAVAKNTAVREVPEETLREIVRRIVEAAQPDKIILFGSAASGRMGPNSDLDLLVVKGGDYHHADVTHAIYRSLRDLDYAKDIILVRPEEVERYKDCPALVIYPALHGGRVLFQRAAIR